jgi:hypothetical protein
MDYGQSPSNNHPGITTATVLPASRRVSGAARHRGPARPSVDRLRSRRRALLLSAAAASTLAILASITASPNSAVAAPAPVFTPTSWWNTPLGNAPVDANSARYIADSQIATHSQNYLKLAIGAWGAPTYHATASDPLYTITPTMYGKTVTVHIPASAQPQPTSDAELTVYDPSTAQVVGLWGGAFNSTTHKWTTAGIDHYALGSDGVASAAGGVKGNEGHRGISANFRAIRQDELLAGAINHRFEIYWWATAPKTPEGAKAYWPMYNSEQNKGGLVPEGSVVRIKPSVDLSTRGLSPAAKVIAQALQTYGAVVGDNSGSGNNLKLQSNADWTGLLVASALKSIPWSDYEFVKGGYRP